MSRRRLAAVCAGAAAALVPAIAAAQEGRALGAPEQAAGAVVMTIAGVLVLFAAAGVGYLYLRLNGFEWDFQKKELPPEPGSGGHHES
ncbi:MAG: hypothetical protein OXC94_10780 [Chloroflexi bacterium]|nr:hypothetical protein [Chloroflexota bacterium]